MRQLTAFQGTIDRFNSLSPSYYSVIQYVPNPIADERINIGVIAFDDRTVLVHFLKNWNRVRNFGGEDIGFLLEFAKRMEESAKSGLLFPGDAENGIPRCVPRCDRFQAYPVEDQDFINFTKPRSSSLNVEVLFQETIKILLVDIYEKKEDRADAGSN